MIFLKRELSQPPIYGSFALHKLKNNFLVTKNFSYVVCIIKNQSRKALSYQNIEKKQLRIYCFRFQSYLSRELQKIQILKMAQLKRFGIYVTDQDIQQIINHLKEHYGGIRAYALAGAICILCKQSNELANQKDYLPINLQMLLKDMHYQSRIKFMQKLAQVIDSMHVDFKKLLHYPTLKKRLDAHLEFQKAIQLMFKWFNLPQIVKYQGKLVLMTVSLMIRSKWNLKYLNNEENEINFSVMQFYFGIISQKDNIIINKKGFDEDFAKIYNSSFVHNAANHSFGIDQKDVIASLQQEFSHQGDLSSFFTEDFLGLMKFVQKLKVKFLSDDQHDPFGVHKSDIHPSDKVRPRKIPPENNSYPNPVAPCFGDFILL